MSLKINDLLRIPQSDMDKVKIKFNQPSPDEDPVSNLPIFGHFCHPIFAHKSIKKAAEAAVL